MMSYPLPPATLAQHVAFLGKTGAGKTTSAKGAVEHIVRSDAHARVCVLDSVKSDWWGLTSSADGRHEGLPFYILGGPRGHVPLHPDAGAAIGELVGRGSLPLSIIDMADFGPGGLQRFFNDFAPALMKHMRGVLHLVMEEAHEFAPKERAGHTGENMTLYWAKKLATAGRSKGVRLMVCTQRIQQLHNALLGSCDTLVAHRMTAPADQEPVKKWLKATVDRATFEKVAASLSSLKTGTGWICSSENRLDEPVLFPLLTTFDNSATPKSGTAEVHVTTARVDQERLRSIIGEAVQEAEANSPEKLKAEIGRLTAELAKKPAEAVPAEHIIRDARAAGWREGRDAGASETRRMYGERIQAFTSALDAASKALLAPMPKFEPLEPPPTKAAGVVHRQAEFVAAPAPAMARPASSPGGGVKPALQKVLTAIAWWRNIGHDPVDRARACVVAGLSPKASTFGVYIGELIKLGLVASFPGKVGLTAEGVRLANSPTGDSREQIRQIARDLLGAQEQRVFDVIYAAHPHEIARAQIAEMVGLSPTASTLGVYISRIAGFGIVENGSSGHVRAAEWLFP